MKTFALILKFIVTVGLLAWLLSRVDFGAVISEVRKVSSATFAIVAILILAQALIAAVRWHYIMRYLSVAIPFSQTLQVFWIGLFATVVLPGSVTGDGVRMWMLSRCGTRPSKCVNSVLLDRVAALTGLCLLVAASLPFVDDRVAGAPIRYAVAVLLVVGVVAGLSLGLCLRPPESWLRFRAARVALSVSNDLRALCLPITRPLGLVGVSIAAIACNTLVIFLLVRNLGVPVALSDCITFGSIVILVTTLPVSLGGWGLREGSMVGLFALIGVAPAVSLSASLLIGLLTTMACLPGALVWLQWRGATDTEGPVAERHHTAARGAKG
jgi:glycosyltransferase 2 family protein